MRGVESESASVWERGFLIKQWNYKSTVSQVGKLHHIAQLGVSLCRASDTLQSKMLCHFWQP